MIVWSGHWEWVALVCWGCSRLYAWVRGGGAALDAREGGKGAATGRVLVQGRRVGLLGLGGFLY